jgi:hypothetical protein
MVTVMTPQGELTARQGLDPDFPEIVIELGGRLIGLVGPADVSGVMTVRVWTSRNEDPTHRIEVRR